MTDRELLELAAKAEGLSDPSGDDDIWRDAAAGHCVQWNPLDDDGDALRLVVKLEIRVSVSGMKAIADWWKRPAMTELDNKVVSIDGDPCAALRRVIVCAAAEICSLK